MVLVELSPEDLTIIAVALINSYLKNTPEESAKYGVLHDRIQEIRKKLPKNQN